MVDLFITLYSGPVADTARSILFLETVSPGKRVVQEESERVFCA